MLSKLNIPKPQHICYKDYEIVLQWNKIKNIFVNNKIPGKPRELWYRTLCVHTQVYIILYCPWWKQTGWPKQRYYSYITILTILPLERLNVRNLRHKNVLNTNGDLSNHSPTLSISIYLYHVVLLLLWRCIYRGKQVMTKISFHYCTKLNASK